MIEAGIKRLKDLPPGHLLAPGTPMCAGCGGLAAVQEIVDVLGENTVFVNAAGCMTLLSVYPFTPFQGSWLYTAMAPSPAGAQGIRDALDILMEKGRLPRQKDLKVVVLSGDGASYGMGLSATSAAMERGLDFIYICYDNEGYANTGQQFSAATPGFAATATSVGGNRGEKKDLFAIWTAHNPVYAATAIAAEPLDLVQKIQKADALKGPRLFLILSPCPTGWGFDARHAVEVGRLAVRTGIWPLKEYVNGRVVHNRHPKPRLAVEAYLQTQRRFAHLFSPRRDEKTIAAIQARVDHYWSHVGEG